MTEIEVIQYRSRYHINKQYVVEKNILTIHNNNMKNHHPDETIWSYEARLENTFVFNGVDAISAKNEEELAQVKN